MVEHDEKNFEHLFEEKFKEFDEQIKIPEIPDAQSIFEKAETKKQNVVPFKKYSKYIAAAAAVVLICVSVPAFSEAFSRSLPQNAAEEPKAMYDYLTSDGIAEETEVAEPEAAIPESSEEPVEDEDGHVVTVDEALSRYFTETSSKIVNGSNNSSSVAQEEKVGIEEAKILEESFDEDKSIFITIEKESVSVVLKDSSAEEDAISTFRIEGKFEGSYTSGEYYIINLVKAITLEDYAEGNYLPTIVDGENESYAIPEESIYITGEVTEGVITLIVEIHIGTGEYKIYASLI